MNKKIFFISTIFVLSIFINIIKANNINVSNISLTGRNSVLDYTLVQFDISWDNSWRTSTYESNWDAAWVFVKWRLKNQATWNHATLNTTGHTAPAGSTITTPTDGKGVFIYSNADHSQGTITYNNAQLRWNYGVDGLLDADSVEVCVYAIEMVYVPQGAFYIGSGGSETSPFYKYPTTTNAYLVSTEDAITVGTATNNLYYASSTNGGDQAGPIPAAFPKGYNAFYCMKYEITQEQYVEFLNKLTYTQQAMRTISAPNSAAGTGALSNNYRNGIDIMTPGVSATTPAVYACNLDGDANYNETVDGQNIACNYISWADVAAYLDWSGLRPMTELEFEKACRGGNLSPVPNEYAWGTTGVAGSVYTLSNSGLSNEVIATNYSVTLGNAAYVTTVPVSGAINGPMRVGIFAGTSGNIGRITAGATYYGIMEMSGNVWERLVTVGNATGRSFTGTHGNGILSTDGNADASTWPVANAVGSGSRGGSWDNDALSYLRVSERNDVAYAGATREIDYSGRGVHTAP